MEVSYSDLDDARMEAYVAQVAALSPADWGRLDALGARLADGAPWARWRRAAIDAQASGFGRILWGEPATVVAFAGRLAFDLMLWTDSVRSWVDGDDGRTDHTVPEVGEPPLDPRAAAFRERSSRHLRALSGAIAGQPARRRAVENGMAADRCLTYGLYALLLRPMLGANSCAAVYAVVEPVIPFASLGEVQ